MGKEAIGRCSATGPSGSWFCMTVRRKARGSALRLTPGSASGPDGMSEDQSGCQCPGANLARADEPRKVLLYAQLTCAIAVNRLGQFQI